MSPAVLRAVRAGFAVGGAILIAVGVYFLVTTEPPAALIGVVVWLAAAVIVLLSWFFLQAQVRLAPRASARWAPLPRRRARR